MENLEIMVRTSGLKNLGPVAKISAKKSINEYIDKAQEAVEAFYAADTDVDAEKFGTTFLRLVNGYSKIDSDQDDDYRILFQVKLTGDVLLVEPLIATMKKKKEEDD